MEDLREVVNHIEINNVMVAVTWTVTGWFTMSTSTAINWNMFRSSIGVSSWTTLK